jgi:hypothetical protein
VAWGVRPGETFFRPSGPRGSHLNVILCDPQDFPGRRTRSVVVVPICSVGRVWHDPTVLLEKGDHPFLSHQSFADYQLASIEHAGDLLNGVRRAVFQAGAPVTSIVLARILAGGIASPDTTREIKGILRTL